MQKVSMIVFSAVSACFVAIVAMVLWTSVKSTNTTKDNKNQVVSKVNAKSKKVAKKVKKQNVEITETKIEITPEYQAIANELEQSDSKQIVKKEVKDNKNKVVYFQKNPDTNLYQEQNQ